MRTEGFMLMGDHSKDWETFENMDGKKLESKEFPPRMSNLKSTMLDYDHFKDAPNQDIMKQISPDMPIQKMEKTIAKIPTPQPLALKPETKNRLLNTTIQQQVKEKEEEKKDVTKMDTFQSKGLFGKCDFYSQCPVGYSSYGGFSWKDANIQCGLKGRGYGVTKFIAEIKGGSIQNVIVVDGGSNFDKMKKYKVKVTGDGSGAMIEPIIDDEGKIRVMKVIDGGSGYRDTPKIEIEGKEGNQCELCCSQE